VSEEELKPCPFCGGEVRLSQYDPETRMTEAVFCEDCNLEFYKWDSEASDAFIGRWNTRRAESDEQ
jgi:Lar family restriction alleviation protein